MGKGLPSGHEAGKDGFLSPSPTAPGPHKFPSRENSLSRGIRDLGLLSSTMHRINSGSLHSVPNPGPDLPLLKQGGVISLGSFFNPCHSTIAPQVAAHAFTFVCMHPNTTTCIQAAGKATCPGSPRASFMLQAICSSCCAQAQLWPVPPCCWFILPRVWQTRNPVPEPLLLLTQGDMLGAPTHFLWLTLPGSWLCNLFAEEKQKRMCLCLWRHESETGRSGKRQWKSTACGRLHLEGSCHPWYKGLEESKRAPQLHPMATHPEKEKTNGRGNGR